MNIFDDFKFNSVKALIKTFPDEQTCIEYLETILFHTDRDFLKDEFTAKIYIDPANSYNTISDDLTLSEKKLIATQAEVSRNKAYWENIVS